MSRIAEINGLKIGEGQPCICIPVVAENIEQIKKQAYRIMFTPADIVEFRADFLNSALDNASVLMALSILRAHIHEKPVLFTFRTANEGGEKEISSEKYVSLCKDVIDSGNAELIDIEYFLGGAVTEELVSYAHEKGVSVIMSNHDFKATPECDEIVKRLTAMKDAGADIAKIAVMPQNSQDVLTLLTATEKMKYVEDMVPVITISMSALGTVSRLSGEVFGSVMTFASAGRSSAPGQIDADELDSLMSSIHNGLGDSVLKKTENIETKNVADSAEKEAQNIVLVGFMGTGKTTVAKKLSEKAGLEVVEIDDMIEADAGMTITEIFNELGEPYFRNLETEQVRKLSQSHGVVISCGGGTVMRQENTEMLKSSGKIILLRATPETVLDRVRKGGNKRPLLNKYQSRGYISWMMKKRRDVYQGIADYIVDVDDRESDDIAHEILDFVDK